MRNPLIALFLFAGASHGAISISGAAVTGLRDRTGITPVSGGLALLIVDTTGDGFIGMGNLSLNTTLTRADDPGFAEGGITEGSFFRGDLVLRTLTTSANGAVSRIFSSTSIADYLGMSFAIVWFDSGSADRYGIVRGADWIFPMVDSGTFTMSATDANGADSYYQVNSNNPVAGSYNFRTTESGNSAAAFGIPEPSVALLATLGTIALFRRRRIL